MQTCIFPPSPTSNVEQLQICSMLNYTLVICSLSVIQFAYVPERYVLSLRVSHLLGRCWDFLNRAPSAASLFIFVSSFWSDEFHFKTHEYFHHKSLNHNAFQYVLKHLPFWKHTLELFILPWRHGFFFLQLACLSSCSRGEEKAEHELTTALEAKETTLFFPRRVKSSPLFAWLSGKLLTGIWEKLCGYVSFFQECRPCNFFSMHKY